MVTTTTEKSVERDNNDEVRRLVDGPNAMKTDFLSKLAGSRLGRWAERYAEYQLETRYRNDVRL